MVVKCVAHEESRLAGIYAMNLTIVIADPAAQSLAVCALSSAMKPNQHVISV